MKDLYLAREEWANNVERDLEEPVKIIEVSDSPEWFMVKLKDGILVSRIDDLEYVELEVEQEFLSEPIEVSAKDKQERAKAVLQLRQLLEQRNK